MDYAKALKLKIANPDSDIRWRDRDHVNPRRLGEEFSVWVEAGQLVNSHPTDPHGASVATPRDVEFYRVADGPGRPPPLGRVRDASLLVKCFADERAHWQDSARARGETVADVVRDALRERYGTAP